MSRRLVITSDTHGLHSRMPPIPSGDILVHCGDWSNGHGKGEAEVSTRDFLAWFEAQPHAHKVLISGNHDAFSALWPTEFAALLSEIAPSVTYLQDSAAEIEGLRFYGSAWTPTFFDWYWMKDRGAQIKERWDLIPDDTDVLVTHGPPQGVLDWSAFGNEHCGCKDLLAAIKRVRPRVHASGHVHGGRGTKELFSEDGRQTTIINAACCDEAYRPVNPAWVIELP